MSLCRYQLMKSFGICTAAISDEQQTKTDKHTMTPNKPYATTEEMMALSLPALRLFGVMIRCFDELNTDRVWLSTREALISADLIPEQVAQVQLELARSGLVWVRHGLKGTRYQLTRPEKRQRRDYLTRISTIGKPRDSKTPTTSKAGEGWRVSKESIKNVTH